MKKIFFPVALVLGLLAGSVCSADTQGTAGADDRQGVEQALATFYASLNAVFEGEVQPMQQVWSHAPDVTYMGPLGGIETGWEEVSAIWQEQADLQLGGFIEPSEIHITIGDNLAFVECYEVGGNLESSGKPMNISIRATSLFRKEDGQWKMIGHHTDPIRGLQQEEESEFKEPVVTFDSEPTSSPPAESPGVIPGATPTNAVPTGTATDTPDSQPAVPSPSSPSEPTTTAPAGK